MPGRAPLLVIILTLATLLAAPGARAGGLAWSPDPPEADEPLQVTASFDDPVEEAHLTVCLATEDHEVRSCLPAQAMVEEGGAWAATTDRAFPAGEVLGINATALAEDGTTRALPGEGEDYVFVTVAAAEDRAVPLPTAGALAVAGALAALATGRRSRA